MTKKLIAIALVCLLLTGCALPAEEPVSQAITDNSPTTTAQTESGVKLSTLQNGGATQQPLPSAGDSVAIQTPAPVQPDRQLTPDEARKVVLVHAGLSEEDVVFTKTAYDYDDDGRDEYEIEFTHENSCYDYDIDAYTGAIRSFDCKTQHHEDAHHVTATPTPAPAQTAAPAATAAPTKAPASTETTRLSEDECKTIALNHAGVSAANANFVKVKLDRDDGRWEYDLEFCAGGVEYEYEINAETGAILDCDRETCDNHRHNHGGNSGNGNGNGNSGNGHHHNHSRYHDDCDYCDDLYDDDDWDDDDWDD